MSRSEGTERQVANGNTDFNFSAYSCSWEKQAVNFFSLSNRTIYKWILSHFPEARWKIARLNELQSLRSPQAAWGARTRGHAGCSPRWANGKQSGDQLYFCIFQKPLFLQNNRCDQGKKKSDTEESNLLLWQVGETNNGKLPRLPSRCLEMIGFQDVMTKFQHTVSGEGISLINDITLIFHSLVSLAVDENQVLFL